MYEYTNDRNIRGTLHSYLTYIPAFLLTYIPVFFARSIIRLSKNFVINVSIENLVYKTGLWQTQEGDF